MPSLLGFCPFTSPRSLVRVAEELLRDEGLDSDIVQDVSEVLGASA